MGLLHSDAMCKPRSVCFLAVAICVAVFSVPCSVRACSFCITPRGFSVTHPRSIEIAIAIRSEIDKGLLKGEIAFPTEVEARHYQDLQSARVMVERLNLREGIELLLVEDASHYRIDSAQNLRLLKRGAAPRLRWVTGRVALHALMRGDLKLDTAIEKGLLVIEETTVGKTPNAQLQARRSQKTNVR